MNHSKARPQVLGHLATMFIDQRENFATEAIGFVLRKSPAAREALESILRDGCGQKIAISRISNQVCAGEESRPDLGLFDAEGKLLGFIEAKFWAGLTNAQPNDYLNRLKEAQGQCLTFLVPSGRVESLLGDLTSRLQGQGYGTWKSKNALSICVAETGPAIFVLSWNTLLGSLHAACARSGDLDAIADIEQIEGLVREFETDGFAPMSSTELSDLETARKIIKLTALCKKVVDAARREGLVTFERLKWTPSDHGAGRYVVVKKAGCWIAMDCSFWAKFQASPFWMRFENSEFGRASKVRKALKKWERSTPSKLFVREDGAVFVPLFIPPGASEDLVIASLIEQIREVRDALVASDMPDFEFKSVPKDDQDVA